MEENKNMETIVPKKSKKTKFLLLSIVCILLASAGLGVAVLTGALTFEQEQEQSGKCTLYWNVAGTEYLNGFGLSSRQVEEDGYYHVILAVDGEQVEYKVADKSLVDNIDNRDVMGLKIGKGGVITDVLDPVEVCAGESISKWYVVSVSEDGFKVREEKGAESGLAYDVKMTENTGSYDVTGAIAVGASKKVEIGDCVRVFRSFEKEVIYVFVVRDADYFEGNIAKGYCEHCDEEVEWYEWTETNAAPTTSRHWRLMNNISLDYHTEIKERQDVVIDLNGYTIQSVAGRRVFLIGDGHTQGTLSIVDQSEKGTGVLKSTGSANHGGIVQVKTGIFNLYSGTLDASEILTERYGCGVHMIANTSFNMYGGTIIGGTTYCGRIFTNGITGGGGASVYINKGAIFTMYGGIIRDGKAIACEEVKGDYMWGIGGNIDIRSGGTFIMEGGKVINGTADRNGGNVYVTSDGSTFIMRGGEISGGKSITKGGASGNVYVGKDSVFKFEGGTIKNGTVYHGGGGNVGVFGTMTMSGGRITGGKSVDGDTFKTAKKREDVDWHNVYCSAGGVIDMSGGTVDGYVRINTKECKIKLSGTARITGADINLSLVEGSLISVGNLKKGAKIGVTGGGFISEKTTAANLPYVYSDYKGVDVQLYKSQLFVGKIGCLCGGTHIDSNGTVVKGHYGECDGKELVWMPWGKTATGPTVQGNWYLTSDIELVEQKGVAEGANLVLDLNGHTIKGKDSTRVYYIGENRNVKFTIVDTSEKQSGKFVSNGEGQLAGSCMLVMPGNKVVMYSGTLDGSNFKELGVGGATLTIRANSDFTMYGGTIIGGTTTLYGGSVLSSGKFVLHDGIIRDGKASINGGNICANNGEFIMTGGKIIDGTAEKFDSNGKPAGTYANGVGGNLYLAGKNKDAYLSATITGGTIEGGTSNGRGGNIQIHQYVNAVFGKEKGSGQNSAVISGGKSINGGNIFARGDSSIAIYAGTIIKDGIATGDGGNVCVDSPKPFVMTGGSVEGGVATKKGGNMYFSEKATFTLSGGTISNGSVTEKGGNIYLHASLDSAATMTVNGGSISGGTAELGGSVYVGVTAKNDQNQYRLANMTINGGTISGGSATKQGGNIYTAGTLTMVGGSISEGKAIAESPNFEKGIGGNICIAGYNSDNYANVIITGGIIEKGEVNGRGGNIDAHQYANLVLGVENGKANNLVTIVGGVSQLSNGGNIFARGESTVAIHAGAVIKDGKAIVDGGNVSFDSPNPFKMTGGSVQGGTGRKGGNIYLSEKSTFTLLGGMISDGKAKEQGGNIYLHASIGAAANLTVNGGNLSGGSAEAGGSVYVGVTAQNGSNVYTPATMAVNGGTIDGGNATKQGGNIYVAGNMTMTGGTISRGKAISEKPDYQTGIGGNICIAGFNTDNYANVTITGGIIEKGEVNGRGGNVDAHQYANLTLGTQGATTNDLVTIADGVSKVSNGGNLFARGDSTVTIHAGTIIKNGMATQAGGGNICFESSKSFIMTGGSLQGGSAKKGGSVYASEKTKFILSGGTINGGKATEHGGNIYLNASKGSAAEMTMAGGTVSSGKAAVGGNVYIARHLTENSEKIYTPAIMIMTGGTINGGWATGSGNDGGGNVFVRGLFTVDGGEITNGITNKRGGNIYVYRGYYNVSPNYAGKVILKKGVVKDGRCLDIGGNIFLDHGAMEVNPTGVIIVTGGQIAKSIDSQGNVTDKETPQASNVQMYATSSMEISVKGRLYEGSSIGIRSTSSGVFAKIEYDAQSYDDVYNMIKPDVGKIQPETNNVKNLYYTKP